jgi:ABC-2 type transport system permease protein
MTRAREETWRDVRWRIVRAIAAKDLHLMRRTRAIWLPIVVTAAIMLVVFPAAITILPLFGGEAALAKAIDELPSVLRARYAGLPPAQVWVRMITEQLFGALYLLVPIMAASITAADAFAGERERKTLEALLYTPATDRELLLGKLLVSGVPALCAAWGGFAVYALVLNVAGWPVMRRVFFPDLGSLLVALWLAPATSALGLGAMLHVSLRARGTQEAMQLGGLLVLPVVALVVGQVRGLALLGPVSVLVTGTLVWLAAALVLRAGARAFRRGELITRL